MSTISSQSALIYAMVIAAVADGRLKDIEIRTIGQAVKGLPVFVGFSLDSMRTATDDCVALLDQDDGIDAALGLVKEATPPELAETAYALACDVVAADGHALQAELRWLEMLRDELGVGRLHAAAIEHGARVRYRRSPAHAVKALA